MPIYPTGSDNPRQVFHHGTSGLDAIVCAICLGIHPNAQITHSCNQTTLWNGGPMRCIHNSTGIIVNKSDGSPICLDWQRWGSCTRSHRNTHECSGCGSSSHGARTCSKGVPECQPRAPGREGGSSAGHENFYMTPRNFKIFPCNSM